MALLPCAPMRITDFDYELPRELIARYPTPHRRGSRLLAIDAGIQDLEFSDLPALLRRGDLLVFNDTRVIKARLTGRKETGGKAEILVERIEGEIQRRAPGEIPSLEIGERVMEELQGLDEVAYVRFASVYRHFKDVNEFLDEIQGLQWVKNNIHNFDG